MKNLLKDVISFASYLFLRSFNDYDELVLVYHSVGNIGQKDDPYKLNLQPKLFKKQLEFISFSKIRNILITFDDGFANIFEHAFPLILKYNIKSMVFVATGFIDNKISFNSYFRSKININPLEWGQIREMAASGVEIGSHTLTHPNLLNLPYHKATEEINNSKKRIEDIICKKVKYFAYPYGSKTTFNNQIKQIVNDCGYERAYTNIMGFNKANTDPYELRRIRIYSDDNIFRFKMKINGAYNWVEYFSAC